MSCLVVLAVTGCAADSGTAERSCAAPDIFRIDQIAVPHNNTAAREAALDLDGDRTVDNQVGMVSGALSGQLGVDFSSSANLRLASDVTWFLAVRTCSDDEVAVTLLPTEDVGELVHLTGPVIDGRISARGNDGAMPVSTMFDPSATHPTPGWLRPLASAIELQPLAGGGWEGRVAMGFEVAPMVDAVTRPMAAYLNEHDLYLDYFDTNGDGTITLMELQESSIAKSLLAPDLEIRGDDALSFAITFAARAR